MSVLVIPVEPGVLDQSLEVQLEQLTFGLRLLWNRRVERWTLDLDAGPHRIFAGHVLATGWPVLHRYLDHRGPPGELVVIDTTGRDEEPGLDDLGARHLLCYLEASDV